MWGALSDETTGLSFTIAASPRQRSHSRVQVPWDSRPYFTVSGSRLPFRLAGLRCNYSTPTPGLLRSRYIASARTAHKKLWTTAHLLLCNVTDVEKSCLLRHCLATGVFAEPFPSNSSQPWLPNSGFRQTCHNIYNISCRCNTSLLQFFQFP
jgi:hypothetical protein